MKSRYLIIADDFTGAGDTGVQLRRHGYPARIYFQAPAEFSEEISIVIDTETRGLEADEAARKVKKDLERIDLSSFTYLIKKTDSLLRGNIPEEIRAADECFGSGLVLFMPAIPDLGRTTINGVHLLNGVPVSETEISQDPTRPVTESQIRLLLEKVYQEPVRLITEEEIKSGKISFRDGRVFVSDACTNTDMQTVIRAALNDGRRVLFAGASAIADNLIAMECCEKPVLGITGSVSEVTRAQVKFARKKGISVISIPVLEVLLGRSDPEAYVRKSCDLLRNGKDVLIVSDATLDRQDLICPEQAAEQLGLAGMEVSRKTDELLGNIGKRVLAGSEVSGLFLTGGDTAVSLLQKAGAEGADIVDEVISGMPMLLLRGGAFPGLRMITKSGTFGNEDAIVQAFRKLQAESLKSC